MLQLPFYLVNYVNKHKYVIVFKPFVSYFYNFTNKQITIQQYSPTNPSASYTAYDVRNVIANQGGMITLANLNGTYASEVPYAYFRLSFS